MLQTPASSKAPAYRRKAHLCENLAVHARSGADSEQLLEMRDAWLSRAANEDWLDGAPPVPPANSNALMTAPEAQRSRATSW